MQTRSEDTKGKPALVEVRILWLAPVLVLLSLWLNYSIANASSLHVDQFAPVVVRSERLANYGKDPANLVFPAVDPQLFEQVLQDQGLNPSGQTITGPTGAVATPSTNVTGTPQPGQPTATPQPGGLLPTTIGAIPTVVGVVPTVVGVVPTVVGVVPTVINIVPTAVNIVPTTVSAVPTVISAVPTAACTLLPFLCP